MTAKLTRLTHKMAIQLHLVAESCTICSFGSRRPVRKLLDTLSYSTGNLNEPKFLPSAPIAQQRLSRSVLFPLCFFQNSHLQRAPYHWTFSLLWLDDFVLSFGGAYCQKKSNCQSRELSQRLCNYLFQIL
jgi:hypothetical protein